MKKRTIYIFLYLVIAMLLFQQCKKDDNTQSPPVDYRVNTIFGKVVDKTTGQGIAHARVYLLKAQNVILQNPAWITTATQYSDSSGNFSFAAIPNNDTIYSVYCTKDLFFDDGNNQTVIPYIKVGYATQVQLQPMAWLKLHVKNVNPFDDFDYISFSSPWGGGARPFYGKNIDTLLFAQVYGNFNVPVTYFITKNKIDTVLNYRVYCKAFDTTQINIFY